MMWHWQDGAGVWGWIWMVFMVALLWIPLILAVVWMLKQMGGGSRPSTGPEGDGDAVEIARRAYARGELPRERYLEIIGDLQHVGGDRRGGA